MTPPNIEAAAQCINSARELLQQAAKHLGVQAVHLSGSAAYLHSGNMCSMSIPTPSETEESALSRAHAEIHSGLAIRAEVARLEAIARANLNLPTT